uniref:E-beta-farnesene synthase n=1 Tax=Tanacetum cinerariifolium TaxID=118510 RepID=A0A6L2N1U1_TANCI|nr:hypothetical protein [Tanacetum cinerariifolium]
MDFYNLVLLLKISANGNSFNPVPRITTNEDGTSTLTILGPVTTEEKAQKKNNVKARSMLLMALLNEHLLSFSQYKDAKTLFEAIQARFGGCRKLLASWLFWKNKPDLETISFDDLYNNFKIVEQEVRRTITSSSSSGSQNMAFLSTPGSTNEVDNATIQVSTVSTPVSTKKHKFHPRPDSSLHLHNEEPVLGYLKFSVKGTKREVFGMPIHGSLITADIQEASYYQEYLANVAKHRRYLADKTGSDPDSPASLLKLKNKKYGFVSKKRTLKSVAEDAPAKEPHDYAEDADMQKALEESLKSMYDVPRGPLPPLVIREPELGKYQPLLEVPKKGKAKSDSEEESKRFVPGVGEGGQGEGQAGPDSGAQAEGQAGLGPGAQDESQARSNPDEQSEGQAGPDPIILELMNNLCQPSTKQMDEGFIATAYPKVQENLKLTVEEHVRLEEPASSSGTLSSLQHLSKDLSFGDLFFSDKPSEADHDKAIAKTEAELVVSVTIQQDMSPIPPMMSPKIHLTSRPESPKVHQLKETSTETTTTTTLSPPPYQQQSTAEAIIIKRIDELEHIMANLIQENKGLEERLDTHGTCLYTLEQLDIPTRDLPEADMKEILHQRMWETKYYKSHEDHMQLYEALEKSMNHDHSEELTKDLAKARKKKKKSRESPKMPLGSPPHQPPPPPPPAGPSGASGAPGASGSSQVPPPPPPPSSTNQAGQSNGSTAPSSLKTTASTVYQAWTMTDIRLRPSISLNPADLQMDKDMALDEQAQSSDDEDIGKSAWSIPSSDVPVLMNNWASAPASNYSSPPEDLLLTQTDDIATFMNWFCKRRGITELNPQDLEGPLFKIVKVFHPNVIHLQYQMEECHKLLTDSVDDSILRHNVSKPLPLGGPPGQVIIQTDFFFNKDLEYLRYDSKGSRPALSISKMKAAYYPDVVLEEMVPDQFWIEEECKYDIAAMYGISHWWAVTFQDRYGVQMMMRFNEIHKFSDGTLHQINEALDYRVKEFRINMMNPEVVEDKANLSQSGELCWWTCQSWRLQTSKAYRMIKSFWHSGSIFDDL